MLRLNRLSSGVNEALPRKAAEDASRLNAIAVQHPTFWEVLQTVNEGSSGLPDFALVKEELEYATHEFGSFVSHGVPSFLLGAASACFAIVNKDGDTDLFDRDFPASIANNSCSYEIKTLVSKLDSSGVVIGLLNVGRNGPVPICVATAEASKSWPLSPSLRANLEHTRRWVAMAFAPIRKRAATAAAEAFGLTELETNVAFTMFEVPTIGLAADRLGIGRIIARNALDSARRKLAARSTTALIRRLTDFTCSLGRADDTATFTAAMNITSAEARVAHLMAQGLTKKVTASVLGVSLATVRTQVNSVFAKIGIERAKDLGRIGAEINALGKIATASELLLYKSPDSTPLRIIATANDRHIAFVDYGPQRNRPLLFCHALVSGRTIPPPLLASLQRVGYRPIVPQRPGYGLTDLDEGDYLATAANDMAAILDSLRIKTTDLFARDIAAAPALAFAANFPAMIENCLLLNPQSPHQSSRYPSPLSVASAVMQRHPTIVQPFFEVLRRQLSGERVHALLRASFKGGVDSDVAALKDPALIGWMTHDMQAMVAHSSAGPVRERLVYANDWRPPVKGIGGAWTVAYCAQLGDKDWMSWWEHLPDVRLCSVPHGGLLLSVTHPETLISLLERSSH